MPFILFDSQDPATDRWQPLWGSPDGVAARAVEPIKQSEPYYYDVLRRHLDVVCKVLHAAGMWPPSVPLLIDACQPVQLPTAAGDRRAALGASTRALKRRADAHGTLRRLSPQGRQGPLRRRVPARGRAGAGRPHSSSPHASPATGEAVAVRLVEALRQRAVVMWRTHADTMPDEAAALSVLALADLHDAAEHAGAPWTLLLDEFGAVIKMAAQRGVAILQRGRSHGGQVIVITQSAADIEALTGQPGLLASLTDNFAGVVAHRQTSPESRDWLAKLMGTRALWQTTNQTGAHGAHAHRPRQRPTRPRVPDRLRHLRRPRPRRSRDLHAARRRARPRAHPPRPTARRSHPDGSPPPAPGTPARSPVHPEDALPDLTPHGTTSAGEHPAATVRIPMCSNTADRRTGQPPAAGQASPQANGMTADHRATVGHGHAIS